MAISHKEAAKQIIDSLPEDATLDDIVRALEGESGHQDQAGQIAAPSDVDDVTYHLEREGWATVLVPDQPVPQLTAEMVNEVIQEIRCERVDYWLGLTEESGG